MRWRNDRVPRPPPAPTTRPALVTVTRTIPMTACDGVASPSEATSAINTAQQERCFLMGPASLGSRSKLGRRRPTVTEFRQGFGRHELQPLHRAVTDVLQACSVPCEVSGGKRS